ncbi:MAG: hypothetical protein H6999_03045 [Hahellaceae bacterium]|nr:hypothetical protein [Hahellaceae bacterium]MCP5168721.1 hypothetical protein [Hahellaceae bacterium]
MKESMKDQLNQLVAERVEMAMTGRFRCELGSSFTGQEMNESERRKTLTVLFAEIAKGMGVERFMETPIERLDQFAVMSVVNNHDTAGLLRSLVNSFMIAYSVPETSERAFKLLLEIEALRAEVAESRNRQSTNDKMVNAANRLQAELKGLVSDGRGANHEFKILIGPDRLFVRLSSPVQGLPKSVNGVLVEYLQHEQEYPVQ